MTIREWESSDANSYVLGMITFRDKAGANPTADAPRYCYYTILLPNGRRSPMQREDRLALVAKANP